MNDPYLLNFTPTGMIPTKKMTPHVPIEPQEIVEQVLEASELGANVAHLHARDQEKGLPTYEKEVYAEIITGIRKHNKELVLCVSTSGRIHSAFEQRSDCLDLTGEIKPDLASLTLSSLNFNKRASINSPEMIQNLAEKMLQNGIKPELEIFDLGMINYAHYLIRKGLVKPPYYCILILGNIACAQANLLSLGLMVKELPEQALWCVGGIGDYQLKMNAMSLTAGGGIRVGLEDNIFFEPDRKRLATNRELIERMIKVGQALGRRPYSHGKAREVLGLS